MWKRENIEFRAEYLAGLIVNIWKYFGDESIQNAQPSSLKGSIPKLLYIFGQEHSVKSWRDVLETTLNAIADLEPEKLWNSSLVCWDGMKRIFAALEN